MFALTAAENKDWVLTVTDYGSDQNTFISSVQNGRIAASQFHPEKSGFNGLQMLSNFLEMATLVELPAMPAIAAELAAAAAPYTDYSCRVVDLLPAELSAQGHVWKRPAELEVLPFWSRSGVVSTSESSAEEEQSAAAATATPWCVVDFFVPPTPEEAAGMALSVEGQVQRLIIEATAEENLCQMYFGWTPWL